MPNFKNIPVKPVKKVAYCDYCNSKEPLEATGEVLMSNPPKYQHRCPNCNSEYTLPKEYPFVKFKEV